MCGCVDDVYIRCACACVRVRALVCHSPHVSLIPLLACPPSPTGLLALGAGLDPGPVEGEEPSDSEAATLSSPRSDSDSHRDLSTRSPLFRPVPPPSSAIAAPPAAAALEGGDCKMSGDERGDEEDLPAGSHAGPNGGSHLYEAVAADTEDAPTASPGRESRPGRPYGAPAAGRQGSNGRSGWARSAGRWWGPVGAPSRDAAASAAAAGGHLPPSPHRRGRKRGRAEGIGGGIGGGGGVSGVGGGGDAVSGGEGGPRQPAPRPRPPPKPRTTSPRAASTAR